MSSGATAEGRAARASLAAPSNANPPAVEAYSCADENGDRNETSGAASDDLARAAATTVDGSSSRDENAPGGRVEERNALAPKTPDPESRAASTLAPDGNPSPRSHRATSGLTTTPGNSKVMHGNSKRLRD